ncbi:MAG: hypothetical protein FJW92_05445 [Actinobacteria bacterium]|nr:hypothetical protein [Actinomycetota bacterium]
MRDETEQEAPEAVEEAPEAEAAVATDEAPAEDAPGEEPAADEAAEPVAEEPVAEEEIVEEGTPAEEYDAEETTSTPRAREGLATLYLCERGHRTLSIWSEPPTACHAPISAKAECGRPVYHSTELPEQVQRALNPLKASKKSSKGAG